jgi:probable HAF family extracellular repeat protein
MIYNKSGCIQWRRLIAVCFAFAASVRSADATSFIPLGDLPGGTFDSEATGVSANGSIVVGSSSSYPTSDGAFRWTSAGGMVPLSDLHSGAALGPYDISGDGNVIVGYGGQAIRWTVNEGGVSLGVLQAGDNQSAAYAASWDGSVIVGDSSSGGSHHEAFRWTNSGGMIGLGDIPGGNAFSIAYSVSADGLVVAGVGTSASGTEAFRWTSGTGMVGLGDLPGGNFYSWAFGVSADGSTIVGYSNASEFGEQAFRWTTNEEMVGLGYLPGQHYSYATSTSADGSIIVGISAYSSNTTKDVFVWNATHGMRSLRDLLLPDAGNALDGWTLDTVNAISADGQTVVGWGVNPNGQHEAWVARLGQSVPEPASWVLVGITVAVALTSRARRLPAQTAC